MSFETQVFNLQVLTRTEFENPQKSHFRPEKGHSLVYFNRVVIDGKFQFQAQDSFLEYIFFLDLKIWKTNRTFWKKATFRC